VRGGHPLIFFQGQYRNLGEQEPPD